MALKADEFARRDATSIQWRDEPLRASWHFDQLVSSDAHTLEGSFECSIRVARHAADRQILVETFLSNTDSLTLAHVVRHLSPTLQTALGTLISAQTVAEALDSTRHSMWIESLRKAADTVAFSVGVELLSPSHLHLNSVSFQKQKRREIATERHRNDIQRATELLKQFQAMRQAAPDIPAGRLLQQFAPDDRGLAFQSLLLADSTRCNTSPLWAVAGPSLVRIDPRSTPPPVQLFELPNDLGPLRSVQPASIDGKDILLIGAQRGVIIFAPDRVRRFAQSNDTSQLGFNRVISNSTGLWASHSEIGLVRWRLDDEAAPCEIHPEPGVRNLEALDAARLIYSTSDAVVIRDGKERSPLDLPVHSPVAGIIPISQTVAIIRENGEIQIIDRRSLRLLDTIRRGSPIRSAAAMPWQGDVRLLLATDVGPIDCVGPDDPLLTQYLSPYRGLKMIAATTDLIAAVSPDRQRIVVWQNWDGQRPLGEIHITSRTKHRIAGMSFGT